jgi:hypothetical protein
MGDVGIQLGPPFGIANRGGLPLARAALIAVVGLDGISSSNVIGQAPLVDRQCWVESCKIFHKFSPSGGKSLTHFEVYSFLPCGYNNPIVHDE